MKNKCFKVKVIKIYGISQLSKFDNILLEKGANMKIQAIQNYNSTTKNSNNNSKPNFGGLFEIAAREVGGQLIDDIAAHVRLSRVKKAIKAACPNMSEKELGEIMEKVEKNEPKRKTRPFEVL